MQRLARRLNRYNMRSVLLGTAGDDQLLLGCKTVWLDVGMHALQLGFEMCNLSPN